MEMTRYLNKTHGKFGIYRVSNSTVIGFLNDDEIGNQIRGVSVSGGMNGCGFPFGYNKLKWTDKNPKKLPQLKFKYPNDSQKTSIYRNKSLRCIVLLIHKNAQNYGYMGMKYKVIIIKKDHIIEYQFNEFNTKCNQVSFGCLFNDDSNKFLGVKIERNYLNNWITRKGKTFRSTELIISRDNKSNTFKEIDKDSFLFKIS